MPDRYFATAFEDFDGELPASADRAALDRMRLLAHLLDGAVRIPRTNYRIGLDSIASLAPVAGDTLTGIVSMYIVAESARLGVSYRTLMRMLLNIAIDVAGGSVPLVGPIFDAVWKANRRNVALLLEELQTQARRERDAITIEIE